MERLSRRKKSCERERGSGVFRAERFFFFFLETRAERVERNLRL